MTTTCILNRIIQKCDLDMVYVSDRGHGGSAVVANTYLEGQVGAPGLALKQRLEDELTEHKRYIDQHGQDLPKVRRWRWQA